MINNFLSIIYENGMIPIINKPTRVTNKAATAIDHILTNSCTETIFEIAILNLFAEQINGLVFI